MGNLGNTIKKFLSNKNTVTILGVIIGVIVLYFGYNYRVKQAITPQTIPVAKSTIGARTEITADMIDYVNVSSDFLKKSPNVIRNAGQLIGKKVTPGATIPANGIFYTDLVVDPEEMPDSAFANIPDGYTIFSLHVDSKKTYGNSIYPGNYIDLYLRATEDNKLMYGKLIESIEVLDAKDGNGNHVFDGSANSGSTEYLLFAVPDDMYHLLSRADMLSGIELYPVPRNASYSANPGETEVKSKYLENYINSKSTIIPDAE